MQDRWFDDHYYVLAVDKLAPHHVVLHDCRFADVTITYAPQVQEWDVHRFLGFLR